MLLNVPACVAGVGEVLGPSAVGSTYVPIDAVCLRVMLFAWRRGFPSAVRSFLRCLRMALPAARWPATIPVKASKGG
jgi:hypothetical protein